MHFLVQVMDGGAQLNEGGPPGRHLFFHQSSGEVVKFFLPSFMQCILSFVCKAKDF